MKVDDVRGMDSWSRFAYWIRERESIRRKKERGLAAPWTDDAILRDYRFCNVVRMEDRVSLWLLSNWYPLLRRPRWVTDSRLVVAAAIARFFNNPASLQPIRDMVFGWEYDPEGIKSVLRKMRDDGGTVFNSAYIVRGNNCGRDKIGAVIETYVQHLHDDPITPDTSSMEATWAMLETRFGFGSFMAGQVVADLRHVLPGTWDDHMTWAPVGPGSQRGMNRLLGVGASSRIGQREFADNLRAIIEVVGERISSALRTRMEAHDWQNCLCEFDKYERALHGEGRPKQKYEEAR